MKLNHIKSLLLIAAMTCSIESFAQKGFVESKIIVRGVCEMCKERIEMAVDVSGVKFARWDIKTDTLLVVHKPEKISLDRIHELLAKAGHDTDHMEASEESYKSIDKCCRYRELEKH